MHCKPKCGGCQCGKCTMGSKQMSLNDKREYERFKHNLKYEPQGTTADPGPYWRTSYPWNVDKHQLINNLPAVKGIMEATKRKLKKDANREDVYEQQLKELLEKGYAREVLEEEIEKWTSGGGKCYYIAHQMVINPGSKSTPVLSHV